MEDRQLISKALERGYLTQAQVDQATAEQKTLADRGVERSLWFVLQELGLVSDQQDKELRKFISSSHVKALEVEGFVILGRIGSGGMGDVFQGRHADGRLAAIKLLAARYSQQPEYARRFQREVKATMRLDHAHITRTLSGGELDTTRYLLMELVPGPCLRDRIKQGPMSEREGMILLAQMALALRYAWARGVLHRDLKPANIILAPARAGITEPFCAKICDFGLAKTWQLAGEDAGSQSRGDLTHEGVALGTPHYMSPEQASGEHDLDQRADIYGLAATVFHALAGQTLYSGRNSGVIMLKQVTEAADLGPLRERGVSAPVVDLLEHMLTKERHRRLRDWDAVLARVGRLDQQLLERIQGAAPGGSSDQLSLEPLLGAGGSPAGKAPRGLRHLRRPSLRAAIVVGTGLALAIFALVVWSARLFQEPGGAPVDPMSFAEVLREVRQGKGDARLTLAPGDYVGPFTLGAADGALTLEAGGPGVRLLADPSGEGALIRVRTGATRIVLRGLTLVPGNRCAIDVAPGALLSAERLRISGPCPQILSMTGGDCRLDECEGRASGIAIQLEGAARLTLAGCVFEAGEQVIATRGGALEVSLSRLVATGGRTAAVDLFGGSAHLSGTVIEARGGDAALTADQVTDLQIRNVVLHGARTGLRSTSCTVHVIDGLTAEGSDLGIEWRGERDAEWVWSGLLARAPQPTLGLNVDDVRGSGARQDVMAKVPSALAAPRP